MMTLSQDVLRLASRYKKIRTVAGNMRKRSIELAGEVRERDARASVESDWLKAVTEELASVKSKMAPSRLEGADSPCGTFSIAKRFE